MQPAEALLLAAGRGERMRPLTDTCPKPLLPVRGKPLAQWHLEALDGAGVRSVCINTAWLGDAIEAAFSGQRGREPASRLPALLSISYSHEGRDFGRALETAGGIARALPRLADPFWLVAGDVFVPGFAFAAGARGRFAGSGALAHLWLVPNPPHNPRGDFAIDADGRLCNDGADRLTYSTIGLFRHALFAAPWCAIPSGNPAGEAAPLAPLLRAAAAAGRITAERWDGPWADVGTPQRLAALNHGS